MSIIWIDDILFLEKGGKRELRDTSVFIYANIISILFTIIYGYFYKAHPQLHKSPNDLTWLKIFLQGLNSFHLLILFAAINVEDDIGGYDTVNFFVKLTVTFSPVLVFACYYINACLAHFIYNTYYDYRKSYEKRILFYKYSLAFFSVIMYLMTILQLDFKHSINDLDFSFTLYKPKFIITFYILGLFVIFYIIHRLYFTNLKQRRELVTLNVDDPRDFSLRDSVKHMVNRFLISLIIFSISFLPNDIMMIIKYTNNTQEFGSNFFYCLNYISVLMISLSAFINCLVKFTDPYLRKIIKNYFKKEIDESEDEENDELNQNESLVNNNNPIEMKILESNTDKLTQKKLTLTCIPLSKYQPPHTNPNRHLHENLNTQFNLNLKSTDKDFNHNNNIINNIHNNVHHDKIIINPPEEEIDLSKFQRPIHHNFRSNNQEEILFLDNKSIHSDNFLIKPNNHLTINKILSDSQGITMNTTHSQFSHRINKNKNSFFFSNEGDRTFDLINFHLEYTDNIYRMIGILISLNSDRIYDREKFFKIKFDSTLPWTEDKYYIEKTKLVEYTQKNLPDWVNIKYDKKFSLINVRVKKYSPLVFHHIRLIDKISIDDCVKSLDPIFNLEKINELKVHGGNSRNSIMYTWDKKMLVKTISKQEKKLLVKELLKNYHVRMRDTKSLLCRIYGLFRIGVSDQCDTYVVIMKNMSELPKETRVLSFDLKGSSVNRECILEKDKKKFEKKEALVETYKNKILKDKDLMYLEIKFNLSKPDAINLMNSIEKDSNFLEKYWITDYSVLLYIHKFNKDDYKNNFRNSRVMKSVDNNYLYCFSIIDFLTTYDLEKKSEKITKNIASIVKWEKDKNFSCQDPIRYGIRFRNFIKSLIQIEDD